MIDVFGYLLKAEFEEHVVDCAREINKELNPRIPVHPVEVYESVLLSWGGNIKNLREDTVEQLRGNK